MLDLKKLLGSGSANPKQVIAVRRDLQIGKGKLAAHVAHASLESYKKTKARDEGLVERWEGEGQKKIVVHVETERELLELFEQLKDAKIPCALIRDAGHTQIPAGTITALGIGPWPEAELDKFTKHLKLL